MITSTLRGHISALNPNRKQSPAAAMSKPAFFRALLLLLIGTFFSCNQDDIFYQIENETALKDPLITGGPSNIVEFDDALYVASGSMWTYRSDDNNWRKISNPDSNKILGIAATDDYLYAVTSGINLDDSWYYRGDKDGAGKITWTQLKSPAHPRPNGIYGAGDTLFVGAGNSDSNYAVYAIEDNASEFTQIRSPGSPGEGMLLGAASWKDNYFISLDGKGVFASTDLNELKNDNTLVVGSTDKGDFTGFIVVDDSLLMVASTGFICKLSTVGEGITSTNSKSLGFTFTGALAVWEDPGDSTSRYLLLGRKGSNTSYYGYLECQISESFDIGIGGADDPQATVESNAAYRNSLGKRAVTSLYQAPATIDPKMPIFASTQITNFWSCRDRVWNYE
jgi:hypothetical protein